jgi:hypothetical protein
MRNGKRMGETGPNMNWEADGDTRNEFLNSKPGRALYADEEE